MIIKFAHRTSLRTIGEKLAQFYIKVFGCEPVYPERNLKGEWLDRVANLKDVHIKGIHLRLPGYTNGPTLELFTYEEKKQNNELPAINKPGFAHIAFLVDDVELYHAKVLGHGGSALGELVEKRIEGVGTLTVAYMRDPKGNIVEILNWK